MDKIISRLIIIFSRWMSFPRLEQTVVKLIQKRVKVLPPDEALRFVFRLDAELYALQGPLAVTYNGGIHTKHRHTGYHGFFVARIKLGEQVLDIGCGTGVVAFDLASKAGAIVDAIDLSETNIATARRLFSHPNLQFRVQDALKLEIERTYDVVVLSNVLEHLNGRPTFLKEVMARSKAKRIFVRVPLFERDWRVPLKKELGVEWRLDPDHKTEFTLENFAQEISEAGLDVNHLEVRWGEIWSELVPKRVA